jgi:selT/selW/selH-like putative selenoprotein
MRSRHCRRCCLALIARRFAQDRYFDKVKEHVTSKLFDCQVAASERYPRSGAFELTVDGKLLFSKLSSGVFPTVAEVRTSGHRTHRLN